MRKEYKMKTSMITSLALIIGAVPAMAQQYAANDYRVCPVAQTQKGLSVVETACGRINKPTFTQGSIASLNELRSAEATRDSFRQDVSDYGVCITNFINSYRRPGADASSTAPDEAACAHAWAEDQVTQAVTEYGRACIEFSNRSMLDSSIEPWSGTCYPSAGNGQG